MYRSLCCHIGILVSVAILSPYPSWEHFIWPLDMCVLADICNHTWIPECGIENGTVIHRRLFLDECDMFEYNCDKKKKYEIVNYSECFVYTECPTYPPKFYRMGNYKFVLDGRKMIYAPTMPSKRTHTRFVFPATTRPMLPERMFHGKRRYSPKNRRRAARQSRTKKTTAQMTKITSTTRGTVVLKRVTVLKNGRIMVKVVKGLALKVTPKEDSDFLE